MRPFLDILEIAASVLCIEIWPGLLARSDPIQCYEAHVPITHDLLSKHVETVIYSPDIT